MLFFPSESERVEEITQAYISKHNSERENQVIISIITNKEKWHCLTVKIIYAFPRGVTEKCNYDSYCMTCLHSFRTETKHK